MSWESVDPTLRAMIERVCTAKERETLKLKAAGCGVRRIARILGISPTSVRDRLAGAQRKLEAELAGRACPSPGCDELLVDDQETRVLRCPMHGPMEIVES